MTTFLKSRGIDHERSIDVAFACAVAAADAYADAFNLKRRLSADAVRALFGFLKG